MNYSHAKKLLLLNGLLLSFFVTHGALASGFLLNAESAADLGEAFSGGAALAEDASTNYYNVAGLARFNHPKTSFSGNMLYIKPSFTGQTNARYDIFGSGPTQTGSTDTSIRGIVPAFYYATPVVPQFLWMGVGITAPTALNTQYPSSSILRYAMTHNKIQTANINVNMAFRFWRQFLLGYGVSALRADGLFKSNILNPFNTSSLADDWTFEFNVNGWGYGANFGALYQPCDATRIGISYRSQIRLYLKGHSNTNTHGQFPATETAPLATDDFQINFKIPPIIMLSIFQKLTPCWDVMATLDIEQWSVFKEVQVNQVPTPGSLPLQLNIREDFNDIFNIALGTRYQLNDQWKLKTGIAYSPSAVNANHRNVIIPVTRTWLFSLGARYQATRQISCDMGVSQVIFKKAPVDHKMDITANTFFFPVTYSTAEKGVFNFNSMMMGVQINYDFC